jgi:hypothetical protein
MQIKKNMFENIFNTVMDMKWKTKQNIKARLDLPLYCYYENMELINDGLCVVKSKAMFALDKWAQLFILWMT